jgi:gamma-glutamyltranspeptidase/glutathione hydrolase
MLIGGTANYDMQPGRPGNRCPVMPQFQDEAELAEAKAKPLPLPVGGNTSQINVADRFGNMIAATASGGWLIGSPVIPSLGFSLSSRGQMFWLQHGLASSLAPGRRPRTTLSPTLVTREGRPILCCGSRGADKTDQWNTQFLLRYFEHGMSMKDALSTPSFYSEHWPISTFPRRSFKGKMSVCEAVSARTVAGLRDRGHAVTQGEDRRNRLEYCVCAISKSDVETVAAIAPTDPTGSAFTA